MATIADISQALGDYMLKGWVLTDQSCPNPGCTVPLVRSPRGRVPVTSICVKCGDKPQHQGDVGTSSQSSTESHISRSSTPPTEVSEAIGSQESPLPSPIEELEPSGFRREQSDRASAEIGQRLLKGWAMLGEECPNETCYGIPLVRRPNVGGEKDPRKECVICGRVYVTGTDRTGCEILIPQSDTQTTNSSNAASQTVQSQPGTSSSPSRLLQSHEKFSSSSPFESHYDDTVPVKSDSHQKNDSLPTATRTGLKSITPPTSSVETPSSVGELFNETSQALQKSLRSLTTRLSNFGPHVGPESVGATADAISKVIIALRQLESSQNR